MAGWLYAIAGIIVALLAVNAAIVLRALPPLKVRRLPVEPVSAGDDLTIGLAIENPTATAKTLLQICDLLPPVIRKSQQTALEAIAPHSTYQWVYYAPTQKRGIYRWHEVHLRTGTPVGLMWCRRRRHVPARAIVYPQVLTLVQCPLLDTMGSERSDRLPGNRRYIAAAGGLTRTLRNYRHGDSMRLIHWRSSARLGEFKVRELEVIVGAQEVVVALDSSPQWNQEDFESAVIAAASLYFYASRSQMNVKLWTPASGLVHGSRVVLETLAGIGTQGAERKQQLPPVPIIWLTQNAPTLKNLPLGSRWLFFAPADSPLSPPLLTGNFSGLVVDVTQPLQPQLQKSIR
jgi:uncharacterized protein (DUF58 family)